jgi:hypothetical protein
METRGSPYLPPGPHSNPDDIRFDQGAAIVVNAWRGGGIPSPRIIGDPHARLYYYLLGTLYYLADFIGGTSTFGIILIHCFVGALLPPYVYRLTNLLYGPQEAKLAGLISTFLPNFLLYSSVLLRDMLISLLMLFTIWQLTAYLLKDQRWMRLALVVPVIGYILPALREGTVVAMAVISPLCLLIPTLSRATPRRQRIILVAVIGLLLLLILFPIVGGDWLEIAVARLLWRSPDEQAAVYLQRTSADSLSARLLSLPTWIRVPAQSVYTVLFPFPPWTGLFDELARPQKIVESISGLVWYILLPYSVIGLLHSVRINRFRLFPIYGPVVMLIVAFGLETAFDARRRLMVMPLILILAAVGWKNRRRYAMFVQLWSVLLIGAFGLYSVLKFLVGGDLQIIAVGLVLGLIIAGVSLLIAPCSKRREICRQPELATE